MKQTDITRKQFQECIEEGIVAAETRLSDDPASRFYPDGKPMPRNWRSKLRKVGREAAESTRAVFNACPLTQAGLAPHTGVSDALMQFAFRYDDAAKPIVNGAHDLRVIG